MVEEWMCPLQLPLTAAEFLRLPQNAAYKYTFQDGVAWINPRPRYFHAMLTLSELALEGTARVRLRNVEDRDWQPLADLFADAFATQQPFAGVEKPARRVAAHEALTRTMTGGDGPWIERASFVALGTGDCLLGAVLVTLLPRLDPTHWDSYFWEDPPPPNCIEQRLGRPHLTWIFVDPTQAGRGIGTALLEATAAKLAAMGFDDLLTTFMLGNESSMLWHWRAGFRLLSYPGSRRRPCSAD